MFICKIQLSLSVQDVMDMMNNMIDPIGMLLAGQIGMLVAKLPLLIRSYKNLDF